METMTQKVCKDVIILRNHSCEGDHETNHTTQTRDEEEEDEEEEEEEEEEEPSQELIDKIMQNLWKYSDCYTIANMVMTIMIQLIIIYKYGNVFYFLLLL